MPHRAIRRCGNVVAVSLPLLVAAVLLLAAWQVTDSMDQSAYDSQVHTLESQANRGLLVASTRVSTRMESVTQLADAFVDRANQTHPMPYDSFAAVAGRFSKFGTGEDHVTSISVMSSVSVAERAAFESGLGRTIRDNKDVAVPAPVSSTGFFMPFVLMWPNTTHERFVGIDPHSVNPVRSVAIDEAMATGRVVASPVSTSASGKVGLGFHMRIQSMHMRPGCVAGFIEIELFTSEFHSPDRATMFTTLVDRTDVEPAVLMEEAPIDDSPPLMLATLSFVVAGRSWHAEVYSTEDVVQRLADDESQSEVVWAVAATVAAVLAAAGFTAIKFWAAHLAQQLKLVSSSVASSTHTRMLKYMNHELRNPMTVIMAIVEQYVPQSGGGDASDEVDTSTLRADMTAVLRSAQKMEGVLTSVCDVSDVQAGRLSLRPVPTDVLGLLRDTTNHIASFCPHNVSLAVCTADGVPRDVVLDGARLRQILTAALQNAITATHAGVVEVRLRALDSLGRAVGGVSTPARRGSPINEAARRPNTPTSTGCAYLVLEVLNHGVGLRGQSETHLMRDPNPVVNEDALPRVPARVVRAAAVPDPILTANTCTPNLHRVTSGDSGCGSTPGFAGSVRLAVPPARGDTKADDEAFSGIAATLSLPLCRRVAVAMGGNTGICDIPVSPERSVTRFWCVVRALPAPSLRVVSTSGLSKFMPSEPTPHQHHRTVSMEAVTVALSGNTLAQGMRSSKSHIAAGVDAAAATGVGCGESTSAGGASGDSDHPASGQEGVDSEANGGGDVDVGAAGGGGGAASSGVAESGDAVGGQVVQPAADAAAAPGQLSARNRRARRRASRGESKRPSGGGTGPTVVVVDDEKMIRRIVERYLKRLGMRVVASLEDGDMLADSLASLEEPPTLVLLDIVMRRSNGVAVLEALRKDPRWASLPIYAMTSNVERVAEYKRVGFSGLVGKPFDKSKLQSVVRHMTTGQADDAQLSGGFFVA